MYQKIFLGTLVALFLVLLVIACNPEGRPLVKYGNEKPNLDGEAKAYLLDLARTTLAGKPASVNVPASVQANYSKDVFVAAFTAEAPYVLGQGNEGTLEQSVRQAARAVAASPDFRKNMAKSLERVVLSVHIMDQVRKITQTNPKQLRRKLEPGVFGMILVHEQQAFFQLGEEVIWKCWGNQGENRVLGTRMVEKRMRELEKKAGLPNGAWKTKPIHRFSTVSFLEDRQGKALRALPLFRANVLIDKTTTRADILAAAVRGGRNLGANINDEGRFGYIYYPCQDEFDAGYNIVRHAGTLYSLFQLYKATGDPEFKATALKGLGYLASFITTPSEDDQIALLTYKGKSVLGSNALLSLALLEMPESLLDAYPQYRQLREKLGRALLAYQMEDGSFYVTYRQVKSKRAPKKQPKYYPGETFLAYVRFYEQTKDDVWLAAATRAAEYQLGDFERTGVPDNWAIQAYGRMYRQKPEETYARACFAMADELLTHQWGTFKKNPPRHPDTHGGFDNGYPPRTTPAASRTEALTEAYEAARFKGDEAKAADYAKAILAAYWFDLNQQYRPENAYWMPNPSRALGGLRGSPIANDIRIDYTQHTITAILHGLSVAQQAYGKGTLDPSLGVVDVEAEGISLAEAEQRIVALRSKTGTDTPEKKEAP